MPRLSRDVRNQAIGMIAAGMSVNAVAGRLNVHRNTVGRLLGRYRRTGIVADAQHPGRPRVTTPSGPLHRKRPSQFFFHFIDEVLV